MSILCGCDPGDEEKMEQVCCNTRASTDKAKRSKKEYLGDSVYVDMDSLHNLVLTTENGLPGVPSNIIILVPTVIGQMITYINTVMGISTSDGE